MTRRSLAMLTCAALLSSTLPNKPANADARPKNASLALSIDTVRTTINEDGSLSRSRRSSRQFRDPSGQVRTEQGSLVTIKTKHSVIMLDVAKKTAVRFSRAIESSPEKPPRLPDGTYPLEKVYERSLGERLVNGQLCEGVLLDLKLPPQVQQGSNAHVVREIWTSKELGIPIQHITRNELTNEITVQTSTLLHGEVISQDHFEIPAGYSLVEREIQN